MLIPGESTTVTASEMTTAKIIGDALFEHYPGHLWAVNVDESAGMADIRNLALSGKYGYRMPIHVAYSASRLKAMSIMAGGEILERYRQRRGTIDASSIESLREDFAGNLQPDL